MLVIVCCPLFGLLEILCVSECLLPSVDGGSAPCGGSGDGLGPPALCLRLMRQAEIDLLVSCICDLGAVDENGGTRNQKCCGGLATLESGGSGGAAAGGGGLAAAEDRMAAAATRWQRRPEGLYLCMPLLFDVYAVL